MAQRAVRSGITEIDPMFPIPDGVDELVYADEGNSAFDNEGEGQSENLSDDFVDDDYAGDDDFSDYSEEPGTPAILGVVSQTLRTGASGSQVVDLVVEVEDIPDADNYELRVTKA